MPRPANRTVRSKTRYFFRRNKSHNPAIKTAEDGVVVSAGSDLFSGRTRRNPTQNGNRVRTDRCVRKKKKSGRIENPAMLESIPSILASRNMDKMAVNGSMDDISFQVVPRPD